jgi:hypothetical protein
MKTNTDKKRVNSIATIESNTPPVIAEEFASPIERLLAAKREQDRLSAEIAALSTSVVPAIEAELTEVRAAMAPLLTREKELLLALASATGKKETAESVPCVCGVGRHTENSPRCSAYISELQTKISSTKSEKSRELFQSYLARENKKPVPAQV